MKKIDKPAIIACGALILLIVFCFASIIYSNNYTEQCYSLLEIENEEYAIYHVVYSKVPANNYEVVTVNCDDTIRTFKGDVTFLYTDKPPHIYIKSYNRNNSDEVYVYIPKGSVLCR